MSELSKPQEMRAESHAIDQVVAVLLSAKPIDLKQQIYLKTKFAAPLSSASERLLDAAIKLEAKGEG